MAPSVDETKQLINDAEAAVVAAEGEAESAPSKKGLMRGLAFLGLIALVAGTAAISAKTDPRAANAASAAKSLKEDLTHQEKQLEGYSPVTDPMETWSYSYSYEEGGEPDPLSIKQHKEHQMKNQHLKHEQQQEKKEHQEAQQKKQKMADQTKKEHEEHQEIQEKKQHQEKQEKQEKKEKADADPDN